MTEDGLKLLKRVKLKNEKRGGWERGGLVLVFMEVRERELNVGFIVKEAMSHDTGFLWCCVSFVSISIERRRRRRRRDSVCVESLRRGTGE